MKGSNVVVNIFKLARCCFRIATIFDPRIGQIWYFHSAPSSIGGLAPEHWYKLWTGKDCKDVNNGKHFLLQGQGGADLPGRTPHHHLKMRLGGIFSYSHAYKDTMFFLKTTHLLMRHLCFRLSTHVGLVEHKPGNKAWYKYHLSSPVRLRLSPVVKNCQSGTGLSPRGPEKVSQSWVFQLLEKTK